jgi:predicted DCC family thiol-disulfide oxidoreductase YuxK
VTAAADPFAGAAALVLFDGGCGLCDRAVRFLLRRDRRRALAFAPLQGETAAPFRHLAGGPGAGAPGWLVLVERSGGEPRVRVRAAAVARALELAGGGWGLAGRALARVPPRLADAAYLAVARRRGRFGAPACALGPGVDARVLP